MYMGRQANLHMACADAGTVTMRCYKYMTQVGVKVQEADGHFGLQDQFNHQLSKHTLNHYDDFSNSTGTNDRPGPAILPEIYFALV